MSGIKKAGLGDTGDLGLHFQGLNTTIRKFIIAVVVTNGYCIARMVEKLNKYTSTHSTFCDLPET